MEISSKLKTAKVFLCNIAIRVFYALQFFFISLLPAFIKQSFEVTTTKKSRIAGTLTAFTLMLAVIILNRSFVSQENSSKWLLLAFCMVFPFVIGALIIFKIKIKNKVIGIIAFILLFALLPIATMTMTECLNNIFVYNMTHLGFVGNYLVILLLYFLAFALSGSIKISILTLTPIFFGFGLGHAYLMVFRGTPFIPMDFLSITTAMNVGSTYDYTPTAIMITAALLFIFFMVLGFKVSTPKFHIIAKISLRVFTGAFFVVIACIFYLTNVFTDMGIKPDFWNQTRGYKNYGFVYNFVCNTKYLYMSTPQGYNPDDIEGLVDKETDKNQNKVPITENAPNIICIMNESLADLRVLGDFTTNEEFMPFMDSLTENTVKGNLYVPVIGAGTSNTEFEFLTGHTTAFLPSGSNAYMLYIKNPIASLVSTLEGQGYSSISFHPYYASGWNRVDVYNNMGFNSFVSLENIMDISLMDAYTQNNNNPDFLQELINQNYPDRNNMLVRQYVSDSYDYRLIIEDYEKRDKTRPYFMFNVTMQNHGGYTTSASNFEERIFVTSTQKEYKKTNKYLSLVKYSDDAFKELVDYFRNVKEPTVICMFGDHQPSIESAFIREVMGVSDLTNLTVEQEQNRHVTPFIIWANYDIEEKYIEKLSANYLAAYVVDVAGIKTTRYNEYLLKLSEKLPVISAVGYIDDENNYYKWSNTTQYTTLLAEYEKIQYNNIFDYKNKNDIFYIEGYSHEQAAADVASGLAKSIEELVDKVTN